ncbi:biotin--[acetyl-CoA-carboxylase] ligase [Paenibacillus chungangensis]|uniref:Bifunctional ligase/repressor BirA n=1 Tax=Paenibacillus chungangensis TaxID=696535 RepID=A0ABW3HMZ4_9BACL
MSNQTHETMLEMFRQSRDGFLSGMMISEKLQVSRTAIWKHIRKLEAAGYEFEASTKLGYRLTFEPDYWNLEHLRHVLANSTEKQRDIHLLEEVASTQNVAKALAEEGAQEGTLVLAEQQLNGRGRMGRNWVSPKGKGIWMSMVLRPSMPIHCAPQLTLLTAVALCQGLRESTSLPIGIKWPNDLLVEGKKISGILLESSAEDERLKYVIAGIGISVNMNAADYGDESLLERATSLRLAAGEPFGRERLIAAFIAQWDHLYELYKSEGFEPIRELWQSLSVSLGKPVRLTTPMESFLGTPLELLPSGALSVKREDGSVIPVFSAEMGEPH